MIERLGPVLSSAPLVTRSLALAALILAATHATHPHVAFGKEKTVAIYVEGADASAVRSAMSASVPSGTRVADANALRAVWAERGPKGPLSRQLEGSGRANAAARLRRGAAEAGIDGILVARVTKEKDKRRVHLFMIDTSGGSVELSSVEIGLITSSGDDAKLAMAAGAALDRHKSQPEGPTETAGEKPTDAAPSPPEGVGSPEPSAATTETSARAERPGTSAERVRGNLAVALFDAEVDAEAGGRTLSYNQPITANIRTYSVAPAPLLRAAGEVFPLADAHFTGPGGFLRDVGVFGEYSRAFLLKSSSKEAATLDTNETSYMVGLRVRLHPAGDNGPIFGISDAYAVQLLTFSGTGTAVDGQLPAARYAANRIGLDGRMPFGKFAGFVGIGYRAVLDGGPIEKRFRGASVNGVDALVGGAFAVAASWEVRLVAHYERYFYAFKPTPGDAFVAGGALDQFFGARLGLAYTF